MDSVYIALIGIISVGSIFLNVVLVNQRDYYKSSARTEFWQGEFWKGTSLLYQKQMYEAEDRHMKTIHKLSNS